MATQDTTNNQDFFSDLQRHSAIQDARISNLETKFEMFMQSMKETTDNLKAEMQDFKNEMRDRDNRRADEVAEIRNSIDSMGKNVRNVSYTAIAAIGAMVVTVLMNLPK